MAEKTRSGAWLALALATLAFLVCFTVWGLISPLAPDFKERYGLTSTEVGILVAVPVLLGAVARVPLGLLTDRYGGRIIFTVLLLFTMLPLFLAGLTTSYVSLLGVAFLLGIAGASFAVGVPMVSRWFPPEKQGMALGIYGLGTGGTALAAQAAPRLWDAFNWRAAFWGFIPVMAVMAVIWLLLARDAPGPRPSGSLATRLAPFRRPMAWVLSLFYFVTFGGFVAISVYLPTYLTEITDLTKKEAALRAAGFVVVAVLARPLGGVLSDRIGAAPLLNIVFIVVAALAVLLAFEPPWALLTIGFLSMAAALGLGNGAVFKLVPTFFPKETGAVTGLVGAVGGLGGFFPPILMGIVRDVAGDYAIGFMLLSEFALGCLIINLLVLQRRAAALLGDASAAPAVNNPTAPTQGATARR
jgi:NNP family nitrate/nitrite transporter-like MFS transporter